MQHSHEKTDSSSSRSSEIFQRLGPDMVLSVIEEQYQVALTNLFRPMNSYINRVYELEQQDGTPLIAKFYRPGRWSGEALQEEHEFLVELAEEEIPVIAPLTLATGTTLGNFDNLNFALFPKKGGRSLDEFTEEQWLQLGRLLGRVHQIGARQDSVARPVMAPSHSMQEQLEYLVGSSLVPQHMKQPLKQLVEEIIQTITPLFDGVRSIRIHGDCHFANLIYRPEESIYLIDFDDMVMGPAVQDIWMLLPGTPEETLYEMELFLEGYETFQPFNRRELQLIEPLRAMRFVHYMAWCGFQVEADGMTRVMEDFGTEGYWIKELGDLEDQLERIRDDKPIDGNVL